LKVEATAPILCTEKQRLLHLYMNAVAQWTRMNSANTLAVTRGEDRPVIRSELDEAAERVEELKSSILAHRAEHGC